MYVPVLYITIVWHKINNVLINFFVCMSIVPASYIAFSCIFLYL